MSTSKTLKSYMHPDQSERVNPQFKQITERYSKIHKQRKQTDRKKLSLQTNLNYIQRTKQSLDQKLNFKKDELKWLKSVRQRHLKDIRYKMEQQELNHQRLQQLRLRSTNARKNSQKNIFQALMHSKQQKLKTTMEVKNQLQQIKNLKKINQQQLQMYFTQRSRQLSQQKQKGKSRINKFFRQKNKFILNNFHEMIKDEEQKSQYSKTKIKFMEKKADTLQNKINKKKTKLKSIEDQISKLRQQASESRIINGYSMEISRLTKKSSRPLDIIVNSSFITTDKNNEDQRSLKSQI